MRRRCCSRRPARIGGSGPRLGPLSSACGGSAMADVEPLPPGWLGATAAEIGHASSVQKNAKEAEPPPALPRGRQRRGEGAPRGRRHVSSRGGPSGSDALTSPPRQTGELCFFPTSQSHGRFQKRDLIPFVLTC